MQNEILDADGIKVTGQPNPKENLRMIAYVDNRKMDSCTNSSGWHLVDAGNGIKKIWGL